MNFLIKLIKENKAKPIDVEPAVNCIKNELKKQGVNAEVVVGGSYAKNTCLKHYDIDIFVRFAKNPDSDLLEVILKNCFNSVIRLHGSRDYFQVKYKGKNIEIVPVLKIKKAEQAKNVTDVSFLHTEWVKKHLKKPEEVKLAKLFTKANNVYGAESYINGFSGYILEILICKHRSFGNMVKAVSKWKPKVFIDIAKYYKNKSQAIKKLNTAKTQSPIIIIDPVQMDRNAAASVSIETFSKFVLAAKKYVENPNIGLFKKTPFSLSKIKKEAKRFNTRFVVLEFEHLKGNPDIVNTKALKVFRYISKQLQLNKFEVFKAGHSLENGRFWFMIHPLRLPVHEKMIGPRIWANEANLKKFISKYKSVFLEEDHLAAVRKRKFVDAKDLVKALVKEDYVQEKVKRISVK